MTMMNASLQLFSGCFDCTALLPKMPKKLRKKRGTKKNNHSKSPEKKKSRNDIITEYCVESKKKSSMTSRLRENLTDSTGSMATATTFDSTLSAESPVSLSPYGASHCTARSQQRERPATVCFLPHEIKQVDFKSLHHLGDTPPPPAESFYFLPLQQSEFADLQETTGKDNWGYFIDFA